MLFWRLHFNILLLPVLRYIIHPRFNMILLPALIIFVLGLNYYQITPPELEDVIRTHPAVKDVSVVGLPHLEDGEWPVACVVLENGIKVTAKEIEDLVAGKTLL